MARKGDIFFSEKRTGSSRIPGLVILILLAAAGLFLLGRHTAPASLECRQDGCADAGHERHGELSGQGEIPDYLEQDADFGLFWDVWEEVQQGFVDKPVADTELFYGSLAGIVASLGDPYSVFFDPETAEEFERELAGSFEGIGAEIGIKKGQLVVVAPLKDTPAEQAGLRPHDAILAIDEVSTLGMPLDMAVSLIRGEQGTDVVLAVLSEGDEDPREVSITRGNIEIQSVSLSFEGEVAILEIANFNQDTLPAFRQAVIDIGSSDTTKLIVDLRNNPGGLLDTAVEVAGAWIGPQVAVIERYDGESMPYVPSSLPALADMETVVLVNGGSASASEIVAGALQDYGQATIVGEQTFGKGSVQTVIPFRDGSAVKLTVARWFTPRDRQIDESGIVPDIEVELTEDDFDQDLDPQMERAFEILE